MGRAGKGSGAARPGVSTSQGLTAPGMGPSQGNPGGRPRWSIPREFPQGAAPRATLLGSGLETKPGQESRVSFLSSAALLTPRVLWAGSTGISQDTLWAVARVGVRRGEIPRAPALLEQGGGLGRSARRGSAALPSQSQRLGATGLG